MSSNITVRQSLRTLGGLLFCGLLGFGFGYTRGEAIGYRFGVRQVTELRANEIAKLKTRLAAYVDANETLFIENGKLHEKLRPSAGIQSGVGMFSGADLELEMAGLPPRKP